MDDKSNTNVEVETEYEHEDRCRNDERNSQTTLATTTQSY